MATDFQTPDWFSDNASAFVSTDADNKVDNVNDSEVKGDGGGFDMFGEGGDDFLFEGEAEGDDFLNAPIAVADDAAAAGLTSLTDMVGGDAAAIDDLFANDGAIGDSEADATLGLDETSGASDMFGGVAFGAGDETADDTADEPFVTAETPIAEAAELGLGDTLGTDHANPFADADYEHEAISGNSTPAKSVDVSRKIWCSVNHRPVYSPLRDLHSKVKAKQFYNDGNLKGIIQVDSATGHKYVETPEKKKYHFYQDNLTGPNLTIIGYEEELEDMEWYTQDISKLDVEQPDCRELPRGRLHILGHGHKLAAVATFLPITELNVGIFQLKSSTSNFELYFALERQDSHPDRIAECYLRMGGPTPTLAPLLTWPRQQQEEAVFMSCSLDDDSAWLAIATNHEHEQWGTIVVMETSIRLPTSAEKARKFEFTTRGRILKVEWQPKSKFHLYVLTDYAGEGTYFTLYCLEQSCRRCEEYSSAHAAALLDDRVRSLFGCFDIDDDGALNQAEYRCFLRTCGQYTNGEWSSGLITDTEWQAQWPQELERFKNEGEGHVHRDAFIKYYDRDLDADEGMIHTVVYLGPRSRIPSAPPTTPHITGNSTHTGAGVLVAEKKWLLRSESPVTDFAFSHERTQPDRDAQLARGWEDLTVYFLLKDGAVYNLFPVWPLRCPGNDGRLVDKLKAWIDRNGQQYYSSYSPVMKKRYEQQLGYAWNLKSTEQIVFEESKDISNAQTYFLHEFWRQRHGDILWRKRRMSVLRATVVISFDARLEDNQLHSVQELWRLHAVSAAAQESGILCTRGAFCEKPVATQYSISIAAAAGTKWPLEKVQVGLKALAERLNDVDAFPGFASVNIDADKQSQVILTEASVKVQCEFPLSDEQLKSVHHAWFKALIEAMGSETETPEPQFDPATIPTEYCIEAVLRTCTQLLGVDGDAKRTQFQFECGQRFKTNVSARTDLPKVRNTVIEPEQFVMDLCDHAATGWTRASHFAITNDTERVHRFCQRCGQRESFLALSRLKGSCGKCGNLEFQERMLIQLRFLPQTDSVAEDDQPHYEVVCERRQADILARWQRKWVPIHTSMRIMEPRQSGEHGEQQDQWRLCCAADLEDYDDDQQMRWAFWTASKEQILLRQRIGRRRGSLLGEFEPEGEVQESTHQLDQNSQHSQQQSRHQLPILKPIPGSNTVFAYRQQCVEMLRCDITDETVTIDCSTKRRSDLPPEPNLMPGILLQLLPFENNLRVFFTNATQLLFFNLVPFPGEGSKAFEPRLDREVLEDSEPNEQEIHLRMPKDWPEYIAMMQQVFQLRKKCAQKMAELIQLQDEEDDLDGMIGELQVELGDMQQRILEDNKRARKILSMQERRDPVPDTGRTLDFPCYDMSACVPPGADTDSDEGIGDVDPNNDDDVDHGLNTDVHVDDDEQSFATDIAALEEEAKNIEQKTAEGESDLKAKEQRLQRQVDELHALYSAGPPPHIPRSKIKEQLLKWKLQFGKHYQVALNVYLSRKFPGQYTGTTVLDGGGASSSSAGNIGGTDSTAVGVNDDNPPKIDSANSQYPVTNATDGFNTGFDAGDGFAGNDQVVDPNEKALVDFYKVVDPTKASVQLVRNTLEKYKGRLAEMQQRLQKKYQRSPNLQIPDAMGFESIDPNEKVLVDFYKVVDPTKASIQHVRNTLQKYKGRLAEMQQRLKQKYQRSPNLQIPDTMGFNSIMGAGASASDAGFGTGTDAFGTGTSTDAFGTGTSTDAFGTSTDAFGTGTSTDPFGASTDAFGASTDAFGTGTSTSTDTFGTSTDAFGAGTSSDAFGTGMSADAFGTGTSTDAFGTAMSSDTFGNGTSTDTFGTGMSTDAFGTGTSGFGDSSAFSLGSSATDSGGFTMDMSTFGFGTDNSSSGMGGTGGSNDTWGMGGGGGFDSGGGFGSDPNEKILMNFYRGVGKPKSLQKIRELLQKYKGQLPKMASILMKNYGSKPTFAGAGGMDFGTSSSMDSFGTSTFGNDTFGSGTTDSTFGSTSTGGNAWSTSW